MEVSISPESVAQVDVPVEGEPLTDQEVGEIREEVEPTEERVYEPQTKERTFAETLRMFEEGAFDENDVGVQIDAGWYDWFCKDSALARKTKTLLQRAKKISKSWRFDNEKTYIFFKNNCPVEGSMYDDFRICDIETEDVLYTVVPRREMKVYDSRRRAMRIEEVTAEVWGQDNGFAEPLVEGSWMDVVRWFNDKPSS